MKKLLTTFMLAFICAVTFAQNAEFKKAVAKYKTATTVTATATRTVHKAAVSKDKVTTGNLYVKGKGSKVLIANGKDALLMNGTAFTMKKGALKAKTDCQKDAQYKTCHDVLESIFNGGTTDFGKHNDVKTTKNGTNIVLTITPTATKKKQMFSSFVVTIDSKMQELRSIRMLQKGGSYTEYTFSNYKIGAPVNDRMFK
jgi:outer membrane lipoprotein-sorting protein